MAQPTDAIRTGAQTLWSARWGQLLLALAIGAVVAHRIFLAASTDFPINDGGLFYAFVKAIAATFPGLPGDVGYNGLTIPFAYPPLSFWMAALLTRLGADPLALVHLMPIAMNLIYLLLFVQLLRSNARSALFIALVLLFLSTNQRSFEWLVMGGGLSRGLGSIFLILTLLAVRVPGPGERFTLPTPRLLLAGVAVAGALLSHLEWGIDAVACFILSRALASPNLREFIRSSLIAGLVSLLLVAPWLLFVAQRHGLAPMLAAMGASPWGLFGYLDHLHWIARASLANLLIPIGLVLLVRRRDIFWPLFLLLCILLTPRHAPTPASLALAIFAAQGALWLGERLAGLLPVRLATLATAALVLLLAAVPINRELIAAGDVVHPVSRERRAAMAWIARYHPGEAHLVLTNVPWWYDGSAEWFPILSKARSVNTLQGREWLPDNAYMRWFDGDLIMKTSPDCPALLKSLSAFEPARFVWAERRKACFAAPDFRPVFVNPQVTIFERIGPIAPQSR